MKKPMLPLLAMLLLAGSPFPLKAACATFFGTAVDSDAAANYGPVNNGTGGGVTSKANMPNGSCTGAGRNCANCGCVEFPITITEAGRYDIALALSSTTGTTDRVDLRVTTNGGNNIQDTNGLQGYRTIDVAEPRYFPQWTNAGTVGDDDCSDSRLWDLSAGVYTVSFRGRDSSIYLDKIRLRQVLSLASPTPSPTLQPTPLPGTGSGLCAKYYANVLNAASSITPGAPLTFTAALTRLDSQLVFDWGTGAPSPLLGTDNFMVVWSGEIELPYSGDWIFSAASDDGIYLKVSNTVVVSSWNDRSYLTSTASVSLAKGKVPILVQYYENSAQAAVGLSWSLPGYVTQTAVPMSRLYPGTCAAASPTMTPTNPIIAPPPTPTYTTTPSPTPAPTVWQGLDGARRLYDYEYIPFPVVSNGSSRIYDLGASFNSAALNAVPKNTARWRIVFQGLSDTVGTEITVETRVGPYGQDCVSGDPALVPLGTSQSIPVPPRPKNLSKTYFWLDGASVPYTERVDLVGDPRLVPYQDLLGASSVPPGLNFADGYNWFFKDLNNTAHPDVNGQTVYQVFVPRADFDGWQTLDWGNALTRACNFDYPKGAKLYRDGILKTRSIYNSIAGWSSYYFGLGGEIGGDTDNHLPTNVIMSALPYGATGVRNTNEITASTVLVRDAGATWRCLPFLGELFPDAAYTTQWKTGLSESGNLNAGSGPGLFRRDLWSNCDNANFSLLDSNRLAQRGGCISFMNGSSSGNATNNFNHFGSDPSGCSGATCLPGRPAARKLDGGVMGEDYNFAVAATLGTRRPFRLGESQTKPSEWGLAPYNSKALLSFYSCSTVTAADRGFVGTPDNPSSTTEKGASAVRSYDPSIPDPSQRAGFYVLNGLAASTESGIAYLARFTLLSVIRTFHDAGTPTQVAGSAWSTANLINGASYRIEQIPYVRIYSPVIGQDLKGYSNLAIKWTERYARWDGRRYTENFPCLDAADGANPFSFAPCAPADPNLPGNPALEWHADEPLLYNLKYSADGGGSWRSCFTDAPCEAGVLLEGADVYAPATSLHDHTFNWSIATQTAGSRLLRVEVYRQNFRQHYGYHELKLKVDP